MSDKEKFIKFFKALANEERLEIVKLLKKNKEMYLHFPQKEK